VRAEDPPPQKSRNRPHLAPQAKTLEDSFPATYQCRSHPAANELAAQMVR
jgi:hypothetical protein